jgi:hypothetical protein
MQFPNQRAFGTRVAIFKTIDKKSLIQESRKQNVMLYEQTHVTIRVSGNINQSSYMYDLTWRLAHAISRHCMSLTTSTNNKRNIKHSVMPFFWKKGKNVVFSIIFLALHTCTIQCAKFQHRSPHEIMRYSAQFSKLIGIYNDVSNWRTCLIKHVVHEKKLGYHASFPATQSNKLF